MSDYNKEVKDFIRSGILEMYVIGNVSPKEKKEVEEMTRKYPAIKQELKLRQSMLKEFDRINKKGT